jgi:hypothetical protein
MEKNFIILLKDNFSIFVFTQKKIILRIPWRFCLKKTKGDIFLTIENQYGMKLSII